MASKPEDREDPFPTTSNRLKPDFIKKFSKNGLEGSERIGEYEVWKWNVKKTVH